MTTHRPTKISLDQLRALRTRSQALEPRWPRHALVDVVRLLCGVNAQLYSAMALSLRARVAGLTIEEVEAARVEDRSLVRSWCMRGTMHLLAADDVSWLLSAIPPREILAGWRWLERRGGLDRRRAQRVLDAAFQTLKSRGPLTRPELMARLAEQFGPEVERAAAGLVRLSGTLGRVCFGPDADAQPTYVALADWLGREGSRSKPPDLAELVRRYLAGYGPAGPRDLAAWWGLAPTAVQAAWRTVEDELMPVQAVSGPLWLAQSRRSELAGQARPHAVVRLLPAFDTYLLGYENRQAAVPPPYGSRVFHGGQVVPTIIADGLAIGTWRYEQRGREIRIQATPFARMKNDHRDLMAEEADDIGRFYGVRAVLQIARPD